MSVSPTQSDIPSTGLAWLTLAVSTGALLLLCLWVLLNQSALFPEKQLSAAEPTLDQDQPASSPKQQAAELLASQELEQAELAQAELEAQKLAAEQLAAEQLAQAKVEEERLAAEQLAAEIAQAELAQAELEAERLAAEQLAAEQLAQAKVEEERLAAEQLAAERAQAELAQAAAEEQSVVALAGPVRGIPEVATITAAVDAARASETSFEALRREELSALSGLAARVRFLPSDINIRESSKKPLDRLFELLFLYSETTVIVQVTSNEFEVDDSNRLISRERALVLVNYLIERGLDEERFRIRALGKERLPFDSHRVTVIATVSEK